MHLSYYDINGNIFHHEIELPFIRIGRKPSMDLSVLNPTVSGIHASISKLNDKHFITDLNSTNGTKLNGNFINRSILRQGDHIQLGDFSLWFNLPQNYKSPSKIIDLQLITKKVNKPINS